MKGVECTEVGCSAKFSCVISVDCVWTEFDYTECSNPCGPGTREGNRSILIPAQHGGQECTGPTEVTEDCNSEPEAGRSPSLKKLNTITIIFLPLAPSLFEVSEQDASGLEPCRAEGIFSCVKVDVNFDLIDQSDRLQVFCTSLDRKPGDTHGQDDTRYYEVGYSIQ